MIITKEFCRKFNGLKSNFCSKPGFKGILDQGLYLLHPLQQTKNKRSHTGLGMGIVDLLCSSAEYICHFQTPLPANDRNNLLFTGLFA